VAAKRKAGDGDGAHQKRNLKFLARGHSPNRSNCDANSLFWRDQDTKCTWGTVTASGP
jgi:hypothetical protein